MLHKPDVPPHTAYNEWRDDNLYQHVKRPQSSVLIPRKLARRGRGRPY